MRALVLTIAVLASILAQAGGATGKPTSSELLTFNEVGSSGGKRVLSRHDFLPEASSLSPDNTQLAYAPHLYNVRSRELWIADVRTARERLVVEAPGWVVATAWAPDGSAIALSVFSSPRAPEINGIWLVKPDGSGLRRLADTHYGTDLAWSPDSRQLVYVHDVERGWIMSLLTVETGLTRNLGEGQVPQWSPTGREIAYYSIRGQIRILTVSNGRSRLLTRGLAPVWSPDARRIAYIRAPPDEPVTLWVVPRSGGHPRQLARGLSFKWFGYPVWSRNGRSLAFVRDVRRPGACRTSLNVVAASGTGRPRRLASESRVISPLAWRGKRVLYQATRCAR